MPLKKSVQEPDDDKKRAAEAALQLKALEDKRSAVKVVEGDYMVQVHIIGNGKGIRPFWVAVTAALVSVERR